jgi:hypothetical protein
MAPAAKAPSAKANYKTYEAQARMVRALVAAHPEVRWNYKGKQIWSFSYTPSSVRLSIPCIRRRPSSPPFLCLPPAAAHKQGC